MSIIIVFMMIWVILLAFNIYLSVFKKTNYALIVVLMSLIPFQVPVFISLNKVNAEIKTRKSKI